MIDNPVLVEVRRGNTVESRHRGAISICDASGSILFQIGDIERLVFPRSAIKPLQALYFVESGAAEKFEAGGEGIALACASHNGEPAHVTGVQRLLERANLTEACLECGAQWPNRPTDRVHLLQSDKKPGALHNNCSGKHSGFLLGARHLGENIAGYVRPDHPAQRAVRSILEEMTKTRIRDEDEIAIDGCSIPTYAQPLHTIALAMARFGAASDLGQDRDRAAQKIFKACITHPHLVAGTERFDTDVMQLLNGQALIKTGAEGYYTAVIPASGIGIALKCDDGATRASEVMMAGVLAALLPEFEKALQPYLEVSLKNRNQWHVGQIHFEKEALKKLKTRLSA